MTISPRPLTWWQKAQAERGTRGWSYAEVARLLGEDSENVRRWFRGQNNPRDGFVRRVSVLFGWPVDYAYDENMAWPPPKDKAEWAVSVLKDLDDNGREIVANLSDRACAHYLRQALEQYRILRTQILEMRQSEVRH